MKRVVDAWQQVEEKEGGGLPHDEWRTMEEEEDDGLSILRGSEMR